MVDGIASFLPSEDPFYEGRYNSRVRYLPCGEDFLSTLPLRIAMQGYPTTVAREIEAGSAVVEIGCAGGIDWFGRRFRMVGMDLSKMALRSARESYDTVVHCDATHMPLGNSSVDGVVSSCLFEHLNRKRKSALLREAHRVLRPGGKLVFFYDIETDNPVVSSYRWRLPDVYQAQFLDQDGHVGYESIEANRQHFEAAGFGILREVFHERTPILSASVWQKLSQWPGWRGFAAGAMRIVMSGPARLPSLAALMTIDATVGKLLPRRYARCMTTVAQKS